MSNWMTDIVDENFGFLKTEYNYVGPFENNNGPEMGCYYTNGKLVLYIGYESSYYVDLIKLTKETEGINTGHIDFGKIDYRRSSNDLLTLTRDNKKFYSKYPTSDDQIQAFSKILKENPEILNGDFRKFSTKYRIIKKIKRFLGEG